MPKKPDKPRDLNPWDRRPWPTEGDANIDALYASIGLFLSQWERHELVLSFVFASFVAGADGTAAKRAYSAVRTFEGRADMLRAASEAYFVDFPDQTLLAQWKDTLKLAVCYSQRRNDIAHGVVDHFGLENTWGTKTEYNRFSLYPTHSSFKERSIKGVPSYCMTSTEISYFYRQVFMLQTSTIELANKVARKKHTKSLLRTLYGPAIRSANQPADQTSPQGNEPQPQSSRE
jgi:hypothetical protein